MRSRFKAVSSSMGVPNGDAALITELKNGNDDALTMLFERYSRTVFAIAYRVLLHDPAEAEETVQQVFWEVYETIQEFDPAKGSFKHWVLKKAEFRAIDRRRRLQVQGIYNWVNIEDREDENGDVAWISQMPRQENAHLIRDALTKLPSRQRLIIELVLFEGMTLPEVERTTNETPASVRHLYYAGLKSLRITLVGNSQKENQRQISTVPAKENT